eukprot:CAMPEP_0198152698 /NCGR_PEP_ID=MMETSP1443-20131203/60867_1 /TAXON_ID=186043 /ORGANISM="Entomoneis sp., Strain CCMP2396" /LENGTH=113 /DNA_ID=CAMNT_0043818801 /DNA_START=29 /DNA_END=367 /DNA_ORIENTATION=+
MSWDEVNDEAVHEKVSHALRTSGIAEKKSKRKNRNGAKFCTNKEESKVLSNTGFEQIYHGQQGIAGYFVQKERQEAALQSDRLPNVSTSLTNTNFSKERIQEETPRKMEAFAK